MHTIEEINARLAAIETELRSASGDALTALEQEADALLAERAQLEQEAQTRQALRSRISSGAGRATVISAPAPAPAAAPAPAQPSVEELESRAFADFLRGAITQMRSDPAAQNFTVANNGAVIPTSIANRIIEQVREMCPIFAGAEIYNAQGTIQIPVYGPKADADSGNPAHDITVAYGEDFQELTADAGAFTSVDLGGYLMGALTLIGQTLINNSQLDITSFAIRHMAAQIALFLEKECLTGTGESHKHMTGALSTPNTLKAGSTSAITTDNLIDLQAMIPQAYQANAVWTLNPNTFTYVRKLKYSDGRYILQENLTGAFPYTLLGKPVHLSDNMPGMASGNKAVLYGDYSGLAINIHEGVSAQVLREKYATQHAIGIVAWFEMDSKVVDAQKLATLEMSA